ncbi:MAG TPA: hypothetical protein PLB63_11435 [Planctomycetota bacterium]|nr:hypothetical protein [Planctomycetota bacterium]
MLCVWGESALGRICSGEKKKVERNFNLKISCIFCYSGAKSCSVFRENLLCGESALGWKVALGRICSGEVNLL